MSGNANARRPASLLRCLTVVIGAALVGCSPSASSDSGDVGVEATVDAATDGANGPDAADAGDSGGSDASSDAGGTAVRWTTPPVMATGVSQVRFMSAAAGAEVSFHVFLPEAYAGSTQRFPVLYFLHGTGAGTTGVAPLSRHFGDAMRRGDLAPMIVVFPYGLESSLWMNNRAETAPVETVVVREIVPLVDSMFRTDARPKRRYVEGFSMGGFGALRYGMVHPTVFGAYSALAPGPLQQDLTDGPPTTADARARLFAELFGNDIEYFRQQIPWHVAERNADVLRRGTLMQIVTGLDDVQLPWVSAFRQHLLTLGIAHEYIEVPRVAHEVLPLLNGMGPARWTFFRRALAQ
jgi:enterochelin esterase-like enzyme